MHGCAAEGKKHARITWVPQHHELIKSYLRPVVHACMPQYLGAMQGLWRCHTNAISAPACQNCTLVLPLSTIVYITGPRTALRQVLLPLQEGGGARQGPIDVAAEYKCCAIHACIDARAGDRAIVDPLVAASSVCAGAVPALATRLFWRCASSGTTINHAIPRAISPAAVLCERHVLWDQDTAQQVISAMQTGGCCIATCGRVVRDCGCCCAKCRSA